MTEPAELKTKSRYETYISIAEDIWEGIYNAGLRARFTEFTEAAPYDVPAQAWPLIYEHFEVDPKLKDRLLYGLTVMLAISLKNSIVLSPKGLPDVRYKDAGVLFFAANLAGMLTDAKAKARV